MAGSALQCGEAGPSARCWPVPSRALSTRTMREQTWTRGWSGLQTRALWVVRCWAGGRKRSALHASLMAVCMLGTKAGVRSRSALRNALTGTGTWGLMPELKAGCHQAERERAYEVRHPAGGAREGALRRSESARAWNAWRLQLGSYSMRPKLGWGQMCSQARENKRASPGRLLMMQGITAHRFMCKGLDTRWKSDKRERELNTAFVHAKQHGEATMHAFYCTSMRSLFLACSVAMILYLTVTLHRCA